MKYVNRELKAVMKRFFNILKISSVGMDVKLDSVYREVESQRIKMSFVNIIPFSLIVMLFEISSSVYNIITVSDPYCKLAIGISCLVFLLFNAFTFVFFEKTLPDGNASDKTKEYFTYLYWGAYTVCASLISGFETVGSGSISHFFLTVFSLTLFAMLEPKPMLIYYLLITAAQTAVLTVSKSTYNVFVFCFVTALIGLVLSYVKYCIYMNRAIESKRFERISEIDPLTGLLNRRGMQRSVDGIWNYCKTHSIPIAFAMLDIDYFKRYNDMYGHAQGDECLREIAGCIKRCFPRRTDITCRFGGEEFIIIIAGEPEEKVLEYFKNLRCSVEGLEISSGCPDFNENVTVSIGVYYADTGASIMFRDAVTEVDAQLYNAKEHGRNCISFENEIIK